MSHVYTSVYLDGASELVEEVIGQLHVASAIEDSW